MLVFFWKSILIFTPCNSAVLDKAFEFQLFNSWDEQSDAGVKLTGVHNTCTYCASFYSHLSYLTLFLGKAIYYLNKIT